MRRRGRVCLRVSSAHTGNLISTNSQQLSALLQLLYLVSAWDSAPNSNEQRMISLTGLFLMTRAVHPPLIPHLRLSTPISRTLVCHFNWLTTCVLSFPIFDFVCCISRYAVTWETVSSIQVEKLKLKFPVRAELLTLLIIYTNTKW